MRNLSAINCRATGFCNDQRMELTSPRLRREFRTMRAMVGIYCADLHGPGGPCDECRSLLDHAHERLARCPYGAAKPTCAKCPVHCYRKARREQVRDVMRHAGPRMIWRHPILALGHIADKFRKVRHPMELRGSRREYSREPRA